jgi:farnesol dehydrogenase
MTKLLITGGTGFIGISLVRNLQELGHELKLLVRESSDISPFEKLINIEYAYGDVQDIESIRSAVQDVSAIFHLAAYTGIAAKDKTIYQNVNVNGTENIAKIAIENDLPMFYISSFTALGPTTETPVDESYENEQFCMEYEKSKCQAKKLVKGLIPKGLKVIIFYPGIVFGPGDFNIFGRMLYDIVRGKMLPLGMCPGKGDSIACFSYVRDLSKAMSNVLGREDLYGEDFILGGENVRFGSYLDLIADIAKGKKAKKVPYWLAYVYAFSLEMIAKISRKIPPLTRSTLKAIKYNRSYSSEKAIKMIDYKITPLREALEKTIEWYKNYNNNKK